MALIVLTLTGVVAATAPLCPFATAGGCDLRADAVEFVHTPSGVHFLTPCAQEIAQVDTLPDFVRSGKTIRLNTEAAPGSGLGIRRYYFYPKVASGTALPARHFYTNSATETSLLESALKDPAVGCFEAADRGFAQQPGFDALADGTVNVASAVCPCRNRPGVALLPFRFTAASIRR